MPVQHRFRELSKRMILMTNPKDIGHPLTLFTRSIEEARIATAWLHRHFDTRGADNPFGLLTESFRQLPEGTEPPTSLLQQLDRYIVPLPEHRCARERTARREPVRAATEVTLYGILIPKAAAAEVDRRLKRNDTAKITAMDEGVMNRKFDQQLVDEILRQDGCVRQI